MTPVATTDTNPRTPSNLSGTTHAGNARRTLVRRLMWTVWALVPVGLLAFHFGPGQQAYREDKAAALVARAQAARVAADWLMQGIMQTDSANVVSSTMGNFAIGDAKSATAGSNSCVMGVLEPN